MSTFRSAASAVRQSISRSCIASTSKSALNTARPYATAQQALPQETSKQRATGTGAGAGAVKADRVAAPYEFGTAAAKVLEGAEVRRYRGKGNPRLNSTKNRVSIHHAHLWNSGPFHPLTIPLRKKGGRDNTGRIAVRNIGGGHKRRLRTVDFWRFYPGIHDVIRIEYDPGRSGHIALIRRRQGTDGLSAEDLAEIEQVKAEEDKFKVPREAELSVKSGWSYILAPDGLRAGDTVQSFRRGIPDDFVEGWKNDPLPGEEISPRALGLLRTKTLTPGNVLPLYLVPPGQAIHNIAFTAGGKMQAARSAGCSASVVAHQDANGEALGGLNVLNMGSQYDAQGRMGKQLGHVLVKMSSGEVRKLSPGAVATVGTVSK